MIYARIGTALSIPFGPILDGDGAEYTGAVVADLMICKNSGTQAALSGTATLTHVSVGLYELSLSVDDISEVGTVSVVLDKTTYVARPVDLTVLSQAMYDALITDGDLGTVPANTVSILSQLTQIMGADFSGASDSLARIADNAQVNYDALVLAIADLDTTVPAAVWASVFYGLAASEILCYAGVGAGAGAVDTGEAWDAADNRVETFRYFDGSDAFTVEADVNGNRQNINHSP